MNEKYAQIERKRLLTRAKNLSETIVKLQIRARELDEGSAAGSFSRAGSYIREALDSLTDWTSYEETEGDV